MQVCYDLSDPDVEKGSESAHGSGKRVERGKTNLADMGWKTRGEKRMDWQCIYSFVGVADYSMMRLIFIFFKNEKNFESYPQHKLLF